MIYKLRIACSVVVTGLLSLAAYANTCEKLRPCQAFGFSSLIFIATIKDGSAVDAGRSSDGRRQVNGLVTFDVDTVFKGPETQQIGINVPASVISCGGGVYDLWLTVGERYLVYAKSSGNEITFSYATPIADATDDLEFLRSLPPPGSGGSIHGQLLDPTGKAGLPDITVAATSGSLSLTAVTDNNGFFNIYAVPEGTYSLDASLPNPYHLQTPVTAQIFDRSCTDISLNLALPNGIAGRVIDTNGNSGMISLKFQNENGSQSPGALSDFHGDFGAASIPPGKYRLLVTLKRSGREYDYYYPGTEDQSRAAWIEVGQASEVNIGTFTLPADIVPGSRDFFSKIIQLAYKRSNSASGRRSWGQQPSIRGCHAL